jgi:site-specific recombinase XerD
MVEEPEKVTEFLSALKGRCKEVTINSYRYTLLSFDEQSDSELDEITIEDVAEYIIFETAGYAKATQQGKINTISNYIAHTRGHAPSVIEQQINDAIRTRRKELILETGVRSTELNDLLNDTSGKSASQKRDDIESIVEYLRRCNYGSRTHAMAEILFEIGCRIRPLQQLDLGDIDFQQSTISIQNSEKIATPPQNYEIHLSNSCIDALEMYVDHERIENKGDDSTALFTTNHGRISAATIRRSISRAAEKTHKYHTALNEIECSDDTREELTSVSPSDFRRYVLEQF